MAVKLSYKLPEDIVKNIVRWSSGFFSPGEFDGLKKNWTNITFHAIMNQTC